MFFLFLSYISPILYNYRFSFFLQIVYFGKLNGFGYQDNQTYNIAKKKIYQSIIINIIRHIVPYESIVPYKYYHLQPSKLILNSNNA